MRTASAFRSSCSARLRAATRSKACSVWPLAAARPGSVSVPATSGRPATRLDSTSRSTVSLLMGLPSRSGVPTSAARLLRCSLAVSCTSRATRAACVPVLLLSCVKSASGDSPMPACACTSATACSRVTSAAAMCACTSVVNGLTNTAWLPAVAVAGARSVKAVPTAAPVSASTAVAGTSTTTAWRPVSAGATLMRKLPSAAVGSDTGSPLSQLPLSLRS